MGYFLIGIVILYCVRLFRKEVINGPFHPKFVSNEYYDGFKLFKRKAAALHLVSELTRESIETPFELVPLRVDILFNANR